MTHEFSSPRLVCRPALPSDSADVLEFTKFIWDGHDYIGEVWRDWLADPQGLLAAAQFGAHAVGIGKVSLVSSGQWWLEGLRVDPKFQGRKISSRLHEYLTSWWLEHCGGTIRLMTSSQRLQVHHLCERTGYTKIGEVIGYDAPVPEDDVPHAFRLVAQNETPDAVEVASRRLTHSNGLMDSGWRFSVPDNLVIKEVISRNKLYWWCGRDGLFTYWTDEDDEKRVLGVGLAACELRNLAAFLMDARRLARANQYESVRWHAPAADEIKAALQQAGYSTDWDNTAYIYERQAPRT
jgi:GNAT superfamily N-acetyltransferase